MGIFYECSCRLAGIDLSNYTKNYRFMVKLNNWPFDSIALLAIYFVYLQIILSVLREQRRTVDWTVASRSDSLTSRIYNFSHFVNSIYTAIEAHASNFCTLRDCILTPESLWAETIPHYKRGSSITVLPTEVRM